MKKLRFEHPYRAYHIVMIGNIKVEAEEETTDIFEVSHNVFSLY